MQLQNIFAILIFAVIKNSIKTVTGQSDPLEDRLEEEKDFIQPSQLANSLNVFTFKEQIDYIISNNELHWDDAKLHCTSLLKAGSLAVVDSEEKINFLSEALSETANLFDNLWIAGLLDEEGNWTTGEKTVYLPKELLDKYNATKNRIPYGIKRNCLSFRRSYHQKGNFVDLNCFSRRPYICEQTHSTVSNDTTHPGWIQLGNRLYKLFYEKVTWENASINCYEKNAKLAIIDSYKNAQYLSRYLLVGRPKLENAWIGAKWSFEHDLYMFGAENIKLDNTTDEETNYPPWRHKTIKTGGCILLDRHLKKIALFVEARCQRLRPYICYKLSVSLELESNNSFIFPERDYIVHYDKLRFVEAVAKCTYKVNGANGIVAQPKSERAVDELLFMMGENKAYMQQIWLGGKYFDGKWKWLKQKTNASEPDESDEDIPEESNSNGYPPWIVNETYTEDVEHMNTCLNMDRENHLEALFYGIDCYYAQSFICQYPSGTIIKPTSTVSSSVITSTTTTASATTSKTSETTKHTSATTEITEDTSTSVSTTETTGETDSTSETVTTDTTKRSTPTPETTTTGPDLTITTDEGPDGPDLIITDADNRTSVSTTSSTPTPETTTKEPDLTNLTDESPETPETTTKEPDLTNLTDESPETTETTTKEPDLTNLTDESPETPETTTKNPDLTNLTDEGPDGPDLIITDTDNRTSVSTTRSTPTTETTPISTDESPDGPDLIVTTITTVLNDAD